MKKQGGCRAPPLVLYHPGLWQLAAWDRQSRAVLRSSDGPSFTEVPHPLQELIHTPGLECLLLVPSFSPCPMWDR